jgi:serine/threonine-protein kinase
VPQSLSPDGTELLTRSSSGNGLDIARILLNKKGEVVPLLTTSFNEANAEISPNGKWIAYQTNDSGINEIYVRPYPSVDEGRWQISSGGGSKPVWSRTGKELFFLDAENCVTSVAVTNEPTFSHGIPTRVLEVSYFSNLPGRSYDVSADCDRFLMVKAPFEKGSDSIVVVLNWLEEVKAKFAAR